MVDNVMSLREWSTHFLDTAMDRFQGTSWPETMSFIQFCEAMVHLEMITYKKW